MAGVFDGGVFFLSAMALLSYRKPGAGLCILALALVVLIWKWIFLAIAAL